MRQFLFLLLIFIFLIFPPPAKAENTHFFQAYQLMQKGQYNQAISGFKEALSQDATHIPTLSNLALCYEAEQMYTESITCWEEYIKLNPLYVDRAKAHLLLIKDMQEATALLKEKKTNLAFLLLEKVSRDTFPNSFIRLSALASLIDYYFTQQEYDKVMDITENILRNYEKTNLTTNNLFAYAQSLKRKGRVDLARQCFQQIINLYTVKDKVPDGASRSAVEKTENTEYKLATAYFNLNKFKEAIEQYKSYLNKHPQNPLVEEATYNLGLALMQNSQYTEALKILHSLQEKYPAGRFIPATQYQIALCFQTQKDKDSALKQYQHIIQHYPQKDVAGDAHFQIGKLLLEQNQKEKAHEQFRLIINRYPKASKTPEAIYILAEHRFNEIDELNSPNWQEENLKRYNHVINQLNRIISSYSSYPYSQDISLKAQKLIMQCYERQAKYPEKREAFDKYVGMIDKFQDSNKAVYEIAKVADNHFNEGHLLDAKLYLEKLVKRYPKHKGAAYAHYQMARCYEKGKMPGNAEKEYKKILKKYPGSKFAYQSIRKLSRLYYVHYQNKEAVKKLCKLLESCSANTAAANIQVRIALCYYDDRKYGRALIEFKRMLNTYPRHRLADCAKEYITRIQSGTDR